MNSPQTEFQKALALHQRGQLEQAERAYTTLLEKDPRNFDVLHLLGMVHQQRGDADKAVDRLTEAMAISDGVAEAHCNLAHALRKLRRFDEALDSYARALDIKPDYFEAGFHRAWLLQDLRRLEEALAAYDGLLALKADAPQVLHNRGLVLHDLGRLDEALRSYDRVLALNAASQPSWHSRGNVLLELERFQEARASYDRAIELKPDDAEALKSRGMLKLLLGDFATGWSDYEYRRKHKSVVAAEQASNIPYWEGQEPRGRSILVSDASGLGDTIQFSRYLPLLAAMGASVTFFGPQKLMRLLSQFGPRVRMVSELPPGQRYDYRCKLLSLPHLLGTDADNIPQLVPYIKAEPERVAHWRTRIGGHGFRVGICWRGAPNRLFDRGRSPPLSAMLPIARLPGVRLISLQKTFGLEQLQDLPAGMQVETLGDDFDNGPDAFLDTAAVMESLDLVLSIDTSITHVAGALGRPVWLALQRVPEWRWQLERRDSPWYPTVRLFRQASLGDWDSVYTAMADELKPWLARRLVNEVKQLK